MVRVFIKGGVWKNSEDEILKAAVMKYGKQQWARVASLLNRKSAKQCKARWNEWLDPSVKKVEWSRAEDEKLLHLAKMLPSQFRTIGPLLGRTANQCQERYERLLDEAAAAAGGEADATAALLAEATSSSRKLRPGEIDPHPETKPARPDPIDMDEDEIEMLQEARARLANTQGKKAKRKQREQMLQEAKRLADLQKRRELKQAGLLSSEASRKAKRRRREIDLGVEIPFHKPAPLGFHDVTDEDMAAERMKAQRLRQIDFKKVNEDQYRSRDREQKEKQKREEQRLRALERANMQLAVAQTSKKSDPVFVSHRGTLTMPAPTVSDSELEQMAKLHQDSMPPPPARFQTSSVTDALLKDYTDRPLPTPMRTPLLHPGNAHVLSKDSIIRSEAENLRRIERGETPLLGGENPELNAGATGTGASLLTSAIARESIAASATPLAASLTSFTPSLQQQQPYGRFISSTPMTAVARGEQQDASSVLGGGDTSSFAGTAAGWSVSSRLRDAAREERRAAKLARRELEEALAALPAPQFEYELATPSMVVDEDDTENFRRGNLEKDQADIDAEERRKWQEAATKMYEARSSVLKRNGELPRPRGVLLSAQELFINDCLNSEERVAENLVFNEMGKLLQYDAHAHPVLAEDSLEALTNKIKKSKKKRKKPASSSQSPVLDYIPDEYLDSAKDLLLQETNKVLEEKRSLILGEGSTCGNRDLELAQQNIMSSLFGVSDDSEDIKSNRLAKLKAEFNALSEVIAGVLSRNDKLEQKLAVLFHGYRKRADGMCDSIHQRHTEFRHAQIEESVYRTLLRNEKRAIALRTESLEGEVRQLRQMETKAQKQYGDLIHERNRLRKRVNSQATKPLT